MPFTVRLSPYLEAEARSRAELLGISLNSLISVALDLHLRSSRVADEQVQLPQSPPLPVSTTPKPKAPALIPERRILESLPVVKSSPSPPNDPEPVLPNNPTKRDRQLLSQWHLRNPKRK
jgi:hypothetical protein